MTGPDHLRATRVFYDAVAADYAERFHDELAAKPLDRSMLAAFAELVLAAGGGRVADLGCGPGRVTAHLRELGLSVYGVDLSPRMVELARETNPDLRFDEGTMTALDQADRSLAGILAWHSVIHTPDEQLPQVFEEFERVLVPGGHLLISFQVGDEPLYLARPLGHPVALDFHRRRPDDVAALLDAAGLPVQARMWREPDDRGMETTPQAFLLARKA
ncbi:class I SAM-dependent DNA methyltransferase [Streptomyces marispadix]|uniref:Methyltransferase domain-containing protein n=1 Tax=Streptomyces marispadix TaxID=2922868 RepID=A0ABS9SVT7_9ACTN|nr:class I SAM-dependent methyltransferase [Streptomyces marispadix]MCH6160392.1 methyltransferase domain-containing protein [Streptomyces marispadix]